MDEFRLRAYAAEMCMAELDAQVEKAKAVIMDKDIKIGLLLGKVERLEKAIQHCDPLCPAWAALEGEQE